jgi:uncharacterized membrane protein
MEILTRILLILHVGAGSLALITAGIALALTKGSPRHNAIGRIYFGAMVAVAVTAIPVSIIRPNALLFLVALFSAYMAYAGWRLGRKARAVPSRPPFVEWAMLVVAIGMIIYGLVMAITGAPMGWALVAFGGIGLQFAIEDIRNWSAERPFAARIQSHLQHMLGGTIATITAVLVQQIVPRLGEGNPWAVVVWLSPTVIITPLIALWSRRVAITGRTRLWARRAA